MEGIVELVFRRSDGLTDQRAVVDAGNAVEVAVAAEGEQGFTAPTARTGAAAHADIGKPGVLHGYFVDVLAGEIVGDFALVNDTVEVVVVDEPLVVDWPFRVGVARDRTTNVGAEVARAYSRTGLVGHPRVFDRSAVQVGSAGGR